MMLQALSSEYSIRTGDAFVFVLFLFVCFVLFVLFCFMMLLLRRHSSNYHESRKLRWGVSLVNKYFEKLTGFMRWNSSTPGCSAQVLHNMGLSHIGHKSKAVAP